MPPPAKVKADGLANVQIRVTADHVRSLKHDVEFLKQTSELRELDSAKKKGDNSQYAHSAQERKAARRALKTMSKASGGRTRPHAAQLTCSLALGLPLWVWCAFVCVRVQHATADEEARLRAEEERLQAEMEAGLSFKSSEAQPSLAATAQFLIKSFAIGVPASRCQFCEQYVLPEPVSKLQEVLSKSKHPRHPIRVFCGHWFHYKCLDTLLRSPPFEHDCQVPKRPLLA